MKMYYFCFVVVSFDFNLETFLKKKTTKQKKKNLMNEKTNFSKLAERKKKFFTTNQK
jgi:hypothetical protein